MISLVVARAQNGAIGKGNMIPWHAPEDLAFFQRETMGGAVIMGRNMPVLAMELPQEAPGPTSTYLPLRVPTSTNVTPMPLS